MAIDSKFSELVKMRGGTETGRMHIAVGADPRISLADTLPGALAPAPSEEPDIVDLTPDEIEATCVALCLAGDEETAEMLGMDAEYVCTILNSVYKKLKGC